jgi:hypothetical protein
MTATLLVQIQRNLIKDKLFSTWLWTAVDIAYRKQEWFAHTQESHTHKHTH